MSHLLDMGEPDDASNRALLNGFGGAECFALIHDGRPVAAAGITIIRQGVGLAWSKQTAAMDSPYLFRRMHSAIAKIYPVLIAHMGLERIEAQCRADNAKAWRWLSHWGFVCESPRMTKWAGGEDYALFARVI